MPEEIQAEEVQSEQVDAQVDVQPQEESLNEEVQAEEVQSEQVPQKPSLEANYKKAAGMLGQFSKIVQEYNRTGDSKLLASLGISVQGTQPAEEAPEENTYIADTFGDDAKAAISEMIQKAVEPYQNKINQLEKVNVDGSVMSEVKAAQAKHPDFMSYGPAMKRLHQTHGTLSVEQLYQLAKATSSGGRTPRNRMVAKANNDVLRTGKTGKTTSASPQKFKSFSEAFDYTKKHM